MRRSGYLAILVTPLLASCGGGSPTKPPERPTLQLSPYQLGVTEGQPASIVLTTSPADRPLDWWVTEKPSWLTLSSDSGTVRGTTTLTATVATPLTQEPGTIAGQLVFTTPNGTATLPMTATVPRVARITISPSSLTIPAGRDTGEVTLTNLGHGAGTWRATSSVPWLSLPVTQGFLDVGVGVVVKVVANRTSLPPGTSTGSIGVLSSSDVSPVQVPVSVVVP